MSKTIKIAKCPLCGESHKFILDRIIEGVYVTGGFDYKKRDEKNKGEKRKQLFTCPNTNQLFEATISLPDQEYEYVAALTSNNE